MCADCGDDVDAFLSCHFCGVFMHAECTVTTLRRKKYHAPSFSAVCPRCGCAFALERPPFSDYRRPRKHNDDDDCLTVAAKAMRDLLHGALGDVFPHEFAFLTEFSDKPFKKWKKENPGGHRSDFAYSTALRLGPNPDAVACRLAPTEKYLRNLARIGSLHVVRVTQDMTYKFNVLNAMSNDKQRMWVLTTALASQVWFSASFCFVLHSQQPHKSCFSS